MSNTQEAKSKARAIELWDKKLLDKFAVGTFVGLKDIHRFLFQEVFAFAGEIRTVNIAKGNFRFATVLYLEEALEKVESMPQNSFDQIIEKYVEMNVLHPFLEGNGRSMRIWLDLMLKDSLKQCIDWTRIDKQQYLLAMERSPANSLKIKHLLEESLTDDIENRDLYLRGIQRSYEYENQSQIAIENLASSLDK